MKLLKLSYRTSDWELKDLELDSVNLIVAKNATGKSRTLQIVDLMIKIITQQRSFISGGELWSTEFQNNKGEIIKYIFSKKNIDAKLVIEESLLVNDHQVLIRNNNNNNVSIKNMLNGNYDIVYPPDNKLVLHTNRDIKKYPFFEDITNWAENSYGFRFANIIPSSNLNQTIFGLLNPVEDIPELFKNLNENSRQTIIKQLNSIGFNISQISAEYIGDAVTIFIKENGVTKPLPQFLLAQGMFRTLSIVIFLEYLISLKKPAMVLIDDLCEGLDYERAIELGKLVFDRCNKSEIQLVATSNDSFLMDVVDIKYWNVLLRKGKIVTALNIQNHPKIFNDFKFTGLSNFDFFSSDFLNQKLAS